MTDVFDEVCLECGVSPSNMNSHYNSEVRDNYVFQALRKMSEEYVEQDIDSYSRFLPGLHIKPQSVLGMMMLREYLRSKTCVTGRKIDSRKITGFQTAGPQPPLGFIY